MLDKTFIMVLFQDIYIKIFSFKIYKNKSLQKSF